MSFNRQNMARVASASTGAPAMWLYLAENDTMAIGLDSAYFGEVAPQLRVNDVICSKFTDRYCWLRVISVNPQINIVEVEQTDFVSPTGQQGLVNWRGDWAQGFYEKNDQVLDNGWLMIANKITDDRPAPQPSGEPFYSYDGTLTNQQTLAKQILFGNRYTVAESGYLQGYRVYTVIGNLYTVYTVNDPLGVKEITEIATFTGKVNGWSDFGLITQIIIAGLTLDLVILVQEPNPTPTTFAGDWNYITPNLPDDPLTGQIVQSNQTSGVIKVSYTDNNTGDRTAELQALSVGDVIDALGVRWSIQTIQQSPTFIAFSVSPTVQASPDGVTEFIFETVTPTPIAYGEDIDYWLTNPNAQGLFIADGDYSDIVPNDNAYGADILVQRAKVSEDWDLQATSDGASSGNQSTSEIDVITAFSPNTQEPLTTDTPLQLEFGIAQTGEAIELDANGVFTVVEEDEYNVRIRLQFGRTTNPGISLLLGRFVLNGVQIGTTVFAQLDDATQSTPSTFAGSVKLKVGDLLTVEIVRDSSGNDSGGVFGAVATLPDWTDPPSCLMTITRTVLV